METRVNRAQLLAMLETVTPGMTTKDTLEQSSRFVFTGGWVITYNSEISCRVRTELPEDFSGAVLGQPLLEVLRKMTEDSLTLKLSKGEVKIKGEGKTIGVRMEPEIQLPLEQIEQPEGWKPLDPQFGEAIELVQDTCGTNEEQFLTVVVHVHPDYVESCDRRQATRYLIDTGVEKPFVVRKKSISHLVGLGMTKFSETPNWVHFRNNAKMIFTCRRYVEKYPSLDHMFDLEGESTQIGLPKGAAAAAGIASVFTAVDKDNNKVSVSLSREHGMVVYGDGTHGWARLDVPMDYVGEPTGFRINPDLLSRIVTKNEMGTIAPGKLRIRGDRWTYVTRLGKIKKEESDEPRTDSKPRRKSPVDAD